MNTAIVTNAAVSTPRIWNCRTTGSLPINARRGGGGALLLALLNVSPALIAGSSYLSNSFKKSPI